MCTISKEDISHGLNAKKMKVEIEIQNLKCEGCAHTITGRLNKIKGLSLVQVDVNNAKVKFNTNSNKVIEEAISTLSNLGYPEKGTNNTMVDQAVSVISCMAGKITR